jgi:uncharacterized protein YdeI (YjbR/CyaY-like superfamily)
MNPKVDAFLSEQTQWQQELTQLRNILLDCNLIEELKWGVPCYMYQKTNIIILGGFKEHFVMSFLKGVLMNDTNGILVSPGENSQSVKFLKMKSLAEIMKLAPIIKTYIFEAIEIEKAGLKVALKDNKEIEFIPELQALLDTDKKFKAAFDALTPGRKRAYNIFFEGAKQSKTRLDRIEKYKPRIFAGKGFNDCVCGLSKKMPSCDGSHKQLKEA